MKDWKEQNRIKSMMIGDRALLRAGKNGIRRFVKSVPNSSDQISTDIESLSEKSNSFKII